jgi:RNA polymerase sigma-70 factor (ECF subfamily)
MALRARSEAAHLRLVPSPPAGEQRPTPRAPATDDAQLIAGLVDGDPTAASAFYDRARPVVDRAILRVLGRRDRDHEDLAQLSMIELIRSIDRYRGECALDGWISTVAAHTVYKHLRRRKTESKIFGVDEEIDHADVSGISVERRNAMRGCIERIRDHLDALESNKAWTFLLHDVCGYDLREIAEITEVSVAAAQGRLSRGRRELLARLREDRDLVEALEEVGMRMSEVER